MSITHQLVRLLKQEISGDSNRQSLQINVYDYTTRVTLDITGDGEFRSLSLATIRLTASSRLRLSIRCSR